MAKLCSESRAQQSMACFAREFGNWSTAFRRFSDWRKANVFVKLFDACTDAPAMEYIMEDGAIIMVQSHGEGTGKVLRPRP
ncbi:MULTISPECIES: hypothetical protein [unclassified Chelatococcus]|uniref:hypothetical protein n=1 Tax=unclassified Chelatococcus TaxID=2638111 RepID=UPI001BCEED07|nr:MULTISPECIES: hypothetical protein [unclassified Chelatococcus]CAH1659671.1 hypothetical protein CHELA41_21742 [Hyphomicrobiales bacterium]MBS7740976.1 transposase [Chelatococcus sp. HY11]MBX3545162.1 transposase [Chelatococcus sp.]MCO5077795.1 hypothetical protein [Chelatococcus sp.]CAH1683738.1 hypothetical protein CHELA20_53182 [Hyphomicrobiales bacterium]